MNKGQDHFTQSVRANSTQARVRTGGRAGHCSCAPFCADDSSST